MLLLFFFFFETILLLKVSAGGFELEKGEETKTNRGTSTHFPTTIIEKQNLRHISQHFLITPVAMDIHTTYK